MAEPEDPHSDAPPPHDDFDDDLVGFASPRALTATRSPVPEPEPEPEPAFPVAPVAMAAPEPGPEPEPEIQPDVEPIAEMPDPQPDLEPVAEAPPEPQPDPEPFAEALPDLQPDPEPVGEARPEPQPDVIPTREPEPDLRAEPVAAAVQAPVTIRAVAIPDPTGDDESELVAEREAGMAVFGDPEAPVGASSEAETPSTAPAAPEREAFSPVPEAAPVPPPPADSDSFGQLGATRPFERPAGRREPGVTADGDARLALTIYACLIAAAVSVGTTALLALFLSWTGQFLVKSWVKSHLIYQFRTSLIGVIAGIIGVVTFPLGLGVFVLSLTVIWVVARGATGLMKLLRREEIRDPGTWKMA